MHAQPPGCLCPQCGTRMARDNTDRLCAACRTKARDLLVRAPQVPTWFWEAPPIRAALAARHMGQVVRAFRTLAAAARRWHHAGRLHTGAAPWTPVIVKSLKYGDK